MSERGSLLSMFLGKKKTNRSSSESSGFDISGPTNVTHHIHVGVDKNSKGFIGLPPAWKEWLNCSNIR